MIKLFTINDKNYYKGKILRRIVDFLIGILFFIVFYLSIAFFESDLYHLGNAGDLFYLGILIFPIFCFFKIKRKWISPIFIAFFVFCMWYNFMENCFNRESETLLEVLKCWLLS